MLEYQECFKHLCTLIKIDNPTFSKKFSIFSFISRLKPELQPMIRVFNPRSFKQAFE